MADDLATFIVVRNARFVSRHAVQLGQRAPRQFRAYQRIVAEHEHTPRVPADWLGANAEKPSATPWGCTTCHEDDGVIMPHGWCHTLQALASIWEDSPDYQTALLTPPVGGSR